MRSLASGSSSSGVYGEPLVCGPHLKRTSASATAVAVTEYVQLPPGAASQVFPSGFVSLNSMETRHPPLTVSGQSAGQVGASLSSAALHAFIAFSLASLSASSPSDVALDAFDAS